MNKKQLEYLRDIISEANIQQQLPERTKTLLTRAEELLHFHLLEEDIYE
jgi:hypothetical protein